MSRDRAKITFDLQRRIRKLQLDLLIFGGHTHQCRIRVNSYWMPEESCTCTWLELARKTRKDLYV